MSSSEGTQNYAEMPRRLGLIERWRLAALRRAARQLEAGSLTLRFPDGQVERVRGAMPGPAAEVEILSGAVLSRLVRSGPLGFAEAYIAGEWRTPDLVTLFKLLDRNYSVFDSRFAGTWPVRAWRRLRHRLNANHRLGAERNIHAHYDLGNEFFARWLDPSMTYSAALFTGEDEDLEQAQRAKYRRLCRMLGLKEGQTLLEIGSGWGGMALTAAREFGARVTSLTISKEQLKLAQARVAAAGLCGRAEIRYQDYRDVEGRFDRLVSIEMFEAVGEQYWPTYFAKVRDSLKAGGLAGLQIITIADRYFDHYRSNPDFIQTYIFPGGMLPSPAVLRQQVEKAGLELVDWHEFGQSYARTLNEWRLRFERAWPEIRTLGFDERFRRIWTMYLGYCEAGFAVGSINVAQIVLRPREG